MSKSKKYGFTLIELLVVISIISMLIAILLPALSQARIVAMMTQSSANVRGLLISQFNYMADNKQNVPWITFPRCTVAGTQYASGVYRQYQWPWSVALYDTNYITDWRSFWSPMRDLSASYNTGGATLLSKLKDGSTSGMTMRTTASYATGFFAQYWNMVGYGMVGVAAGNLTNPDTGYYDRPNITNIDKANLIKLDRAVALVETWRTDNHAAPAVPAPGSHIISPWHSTSIVTYLYNYNNNVARAYWDGHASISESNQSLKWNCTATISNYVGGNYGGAWTYTSFSGPTGWRGSSPWYADTVGEGAIYP